MVMVFEEHQEQHPSFSHSNPLVFELNRLNNLLKDKQRELGAAQTEIKALRTTEASKDKAIKELKNEVIRLDQKVSVTENFVEHKNLEIKKIKNEKKDALAAQYAAEATLRRVHANQKDGDSLPIESFIAPLEAQIKLYKNEIAALEEDKKAMERITKSKENALLEAERILRCSLERALIVEEVQNQNYELKRQIEICQEENGILEKTNRQKVMEVEKLCQIIQELEETILAGGAAANSIRDHKRQISELNEEKRMLERELARAKVCANRVATVVANSWKDENEKVMPIKQWLEERRLLQAEMQRLKDKLAISERSAKAEAQIKEKLKLRLRTVEEGLKHTSSFSVPADAVCSSPTPEKSNNILTSNEGLKWAASRKRSSRKPSGSTITLATPQPNIENEKANPAGELINSDSFKKNYGSGENKLRNSLWASRSKVTDSSGKENTELQENTELNLEMYKNDDILSSTELRNTASGNDKLYEKEISTNSECGYVVSGILYDRLQKEVLSLRKSCETKESRLKAKDQEIQTLMKKFNSTLSEVVEVESKTAKTETTDKEKDKTVPTKKARSKSCSRR
ncbi:microtubule-associated protein 70-5 [Mercurialis annua]|uniref:microtubule-associated protein 70-5 n=1 Tax=Mercurialis annua TaxID=3986 RepID=UPI00215FFC2F|nr:microtubule-associated protein 70-5 [Mercurialis annua]